MTKEPYWTWETSRTCELGHRLFKIDASFIRGNHFHVKNKYGENEWYGPHKISMCMDFDLGIKRVSFFRISFFNRTWSYSRKYS